MLKNDVERILLRDTDKDKKDKTERNKDNKDHEMAPKNFIHG
jgi:hypothetical protein